jgi:hypothetical protein
MPCDGSRHNSGSLSRDLGITAIISIVPPPPSLFDYRVSGGKGKASTEQQGYEPQTVSFCIVGNYQQNASRSQRILLMYSKFTPTRFGKWLPSSGGRKYLRSYSSSFCIVATMDGS